MSDDESMESEASVEAGPLDVLTEREREVALYLAQGLTNRQIAEKMDISIKTVDTHRGHALKKLGLRNNVLLTHKVIGAGLIQIQG